MRDIIQKSFKVSRVGILSTLLLFSLIFASGCTSNPKEITMLAAASTKDALTEAVNDYEAKHSGVKINLSFGGSGALAEQIVEGAKVDLFLSASTASVKKVTEAGKNYETTNLLKNKLVLIQPVTQSFAVMSEEDLTSKYIRRIALGEAKSVPAGTYAQKVLEDLNLYSELSEKFVHGKDVKEVLSWVAAGEADAGFVYQTDARLEPKVVVVKAYTDKETGDINYPLVLTSSAANGEAKAFMNWLKSESGMAYFKKYGFESGSDL